MKEYPKHGRAAALQAMLLSIVLLSACADSGKKSTVAASGPDQPAALAGLSACTFCHPATTADWMTSKHANLDPRGALDSPGDPALDQISGCAANCHDPGSDSASLSPGATGDVPRPVIGCEACHGPGSLHAQSGGTGPISFTTGSAGAVGVSGAVRISAQFATCASCHELLSPTDPQNAAATAAHDAAGSDPRVLSQGTNSNTNSITDTHFAKPPFTALAGTWAASDGRNTYFTTPGVTTVSGYAMDYADEKVCSNCHDPHKPAELDREWAQSAHADRFGGKTGFWSGAWAYFNWTCDGTSDVSCGSTSGVPHSFKACQRCHTTTGFVAYADAFRSGAAAAAEALRLGASAALTYAADFKPELLACNGCHTDNRGSLRDPGAVTAVYDLIASDGAKQSSASQNYPDLAGSNVCMLCHTGRENGDTIKGLNATAPLSAGTIVPTDFGNQPFVSSHYLAAGATVFAASGYEYDPRPYGNLDSYRHDKIGTEAEPGAGTNGPCIGCHMSRPDKNGNHLFLPVGRDEAGVTGIASEACGACHGPSSAALLGVVLEQRDNFAQALEALKRRLEQRGFYFHEPHPYFQQLRTNSALQSGATATTTTSASTTVALSSVNAIAAGDFFRLDLDGTWYEISAVDAVNNTLTLAVPYTGTIASGEYTIIQSAEVTDWRTTPTWAFPAEAADGDRTGAVTGKNNMGAAFNFNLLLHDPGAYAHNSRYVKRLIYDAIDWLDDNRMNYSTGETLSALDAAAEPHAAGASAYLLPNGIVTGAAAERP
jgi:hypothetical protein